MSASLPPLASGTPRRSKGRPAPRWSGRRTGPRRAPGCPAASAGLRRPPLWRGGRTGRLPAGRGAVRRERRSDGIPEQAEADGEGGSDALEKTSAPLLPRCSRQGSCSASSACPVRRRSLRRPGACEEPGDCRGLEHDAPRGRGLPRRSPRRRRRPRCPRSSTSRRWRPPCSTAIAPPSPAAPLSLKVERRTTSSGAGACCAIAPPSPVVVRLPVSADLRWSSLPIRTLRITRRRRRPPMSSPQRQPEERHRLAERGHVDVEDPRRSPRSRPAARPRPSK